VTFGKCTCRQNKRNRYAQGIGGHIRAGKSLYCIGKDEKKEQNYRNGKRSHGKDRCLPHERGATVRGGKFRDEKGGGKKKINSSSKEHGEKAREFGHGEPIHDARTIERRGEQGRLGQREELTSFLGALSCWGGFPNAENHLEVKGRGREGNIYGDKYYSGKRLSNIPYPRTKIKALYQLKDPHQGKKKRSKLYHNRARVLERTGLPIGSDRHLHKRCKARKSEKGKEKNFHLQAGGGGLIMISKKSLREK